MIWTITNQKGGIGKSTTAHNLGALFSLQGENTLLIDIDPQSNLSMSTGASRSKGSSYDLLTKRAKAAELIQPVRENLDIIPASNALSAIDQELNKTGKEYRLKEVIEPVLGRYEHVIIDTPPALSTITVNALTAASSVIIPAQADLFSLEAIKELADTISVIRKYTNPGLTVAGVLLTRYQPRSVLTKDVTELIEETAKALNTKLFASRIREAIAIKEAQVMHQDIFSYSPQSKVAGDYRAFFEELTKGEV